MLFLLNFRFYILKIISYKKHISGYKLSLKNSILDFCPYWNSFENSKLWFGIFLFPKVQMGTFLSFYQSIMNGHRNAKSSRLLSVTGSLRCNFSCLDKMTSGKYTNCPRSDFQREGHLASPLVFQGRRLEDTNETHGISNGLPTTCQER